MSKSQRHFKLGKVIWMRCYLMVMAGVNGGGSSSQSSFWQEADSITVGNERLRLPLFNRTEPFIKRAGSNCYSNDGNVCSHGYH